MISIVWVHTECLYGKASGLTIYIQPVLLQLMKFGTIGFFLISGFLLGEGMTRTNPGRYFYRRLKAVLVPWMVWGFVWFVVAFSCHLIVANPLELLRSSLRVVVGQYFRMVFTQSVYWFVPNFFVCLALVLGLYRRVPDYVQGAVYLTISLFYGVNVYLGSHSVAAYVGVVWICVLSVARLLCVQASRDLESLVEQDLVVAIDCLCIAGRRIGFGRVTFSSIYAPSQRRLGKHAEDREPGLFRAGGFDDRQAQAGTAS